MSQATMNKVFLAGNLTRDPELKYLSSGTAVANTGLAIDRKYTDKSSGELKEITDFVEIEVWNGQAEFLDKYAMKGSHILIEGMLKFESWKSEGKSKSRLKVCAQRIQLLSNLNEKSKSEPEPKPTPAPVTTTQTPNECPF